MSAESQTEKKEQDTQTITITPETCGPIIPGGWHGASYAYTRTKDVNHRRTSVRTVLNVKISQ